MDLCMFFENYIKCYIGSQGFRSFWNEIKYLFLSEYISDISYNNLSFHEEV